MLGKQYKTNIIAEKFTHQVLRSSVAHPELIQLNWYGHVKGYVANNNKQLR